MMIFVGRVRELGLLHGELDRARLGQPRVVMIEGPPGIGKSSLVDRFLATADDAVVLRANGDESEVDVPFGVLDQLLRHAASGADRVTRTSDHVEAGARLLETLGDLQDRGPVVVLLDDAHWGDTASLRALLFTVRRLFADHVLVILVVREGEAERLPAGLSKLADAETGVRLRMEPLASEEVRELALTAGIEMSSRGGRRLQEHSGGNPLHIRALLNDVPGDVWERGHGELPAPWAFASLVTRQFAACPEPSIRLLEAASVLGLRSPLALASRIAGVGDPFEALEAPLAARLVGLEDADAAAEVRFAHPLIRAAIYQDLSPSRRARLHLAAAAAVEDHAASLAHRVAAAPGPDAPLARELEAYAVRCTETQAWDLAASSLAAASRLSDERGARERRLVDAIEAAMYAGDGPQARALAGLAHGFAENARLDAALAYVATGTGDRIEAEARLERAWKTCDVSAEASLAARIAERTAFLAIIRLRAGDAVRWAERALALRPDDRATRVRTAWLLALGLYYLGRRDEAHAVLSEDGPGFGGRRAGLLLADDELDAARDAMDGRASRARPRSLVVAARELAKHAQLEFVAGAWDEAAVLADRAVVIATESDEVAAESLAHWAAMLVPAARGDFVECERHVRAAEALPVVFEAHIAPVRIATAEFAAAQGRHADVLQALASLANARQRDAIDDPGHWPWAHLYADALVALGRLAEADVFLRVHERIAHDRHARLMAARLARTRGALEAAREAADEAESAFAAAAAALPDSMPYERALIELAHGRVLRRAGHRRAAAAELVRARDALTALGARPVLERCVRELDACGLTPVKRGSGVDRNQLTPQESSLARLAATGMSNREIAAELLLSVKTVERHLTHIYRKLGIASRRELAGSVGAQG